MLQNGSVPEGRLQESGVTAAALQHRAKGYTWHEGRLWKLLTRPVGHPSGITQGHLQPHLWCPAPEERAELIMRLHKQLGHVGRDRTIDQLTKIAYWPGMNQDDTMKVIAACTVCDHSKARFEKVDLSSYTHYLFSRPPAAKRPK